MEEIICSRKYIGAVVPLATISALQHFTLVVLICVCVFVSLDRTHAAGSFGPFSVDCKVMTRMETLMPSIFLIPFYLQAVQIHSANGVKLLEA
jgi:hypothetical protein